MTAAVDEKETPTFDFADLPDAIEIKTIHKVEQTENDVPAIVRARVEQLYSSGKPAFQPLGDEKRADAYLEAVRLYAKVRKAGRLQVYGRTHEHPEHGWGVRYSVKDFQSAQAGERSARDGQAAKIRAWASEHRPDLQLGVRGRIPAEVVSLYQEWVNTQGEPVKASAKAPAKASAKAATRR